MIEVGRVCMKTKGHDAGRCVVVELEKGKALVTGPKTLTGVRRRKVNLAHLHPLGDKLDIKKGASDDAIATAMGVKLPAARTVKPKSAPKKEKKGFSLFKKKAEKPKAAPKKEKPKAAKPKKPAKAKAKKAVKKAKK